MVTQELITYIKESRKQNISEQQITEQLTQHGYNDEDIHAAVAAIADEVDGNRKKTIWFLRLFKGRLNRRNFILGWFILFIFLILISYIGRYSLLIAVTGYTFLLISILSLITRRVSDTGLARERFFIVLIILAFIFFMPLLTIYLMLVPGDKNSNEDGNVPSQHIRFPQDIFALN